MIYEDEDFAVILDASPATKGHALIQKAGGKDDGDPEMRRF